MPDQHRIACGRTIAQTCEVAVVNGDHTRTSVKFARLVLHHVDVAIAPYRQLSPVSSQVRSSAGTSPTGSGSISLSPNSSSLMLNNWPLLRKPVARLGRVMPSEE